MAASAPAKRAAAKKAAPARRSSSPRAAANKMLTGVVPGGEQDVDEDTALEEFEGFDLDALDKRTVLPDTPEKPFRFLLDKHWYLMGDPRDVDWKDVLDAINNPLLFMRLALDDEAEADRFVNVKLPSWKLSALFTNWQNYYKVESLIDLNKLLSGRQAGG